VLWETYVLSLLESTSSHTGQVPIDEDGEEAIFAVPKTGSPAVKGNGILKMVLENGEGGVGQTVAAPMASWGEEATRLVRGCVPCGLHQL